MFDKRIGSGLTAPFFYPLPSASSNRFPVVDDVPEDPDVPEIASSNLLPDELEEEPELT